MRILVASPPKTGNVWVERLLSVVYGLTWLREAPPAGPFDQGSDTRELRLWAETSFPDNSVVHQHYWPSKGVLEVCDDLAIDIVTTLRDPYDQFVSLYFYVQRFADTYRAADDPAQEMIDKPIDHPSVLEFLAVPFRFYLLNGIAWLRAGRSLIVRYEDLCSDPVSELFRVTAQLSPVDADAIRNAVRESTAERMRTIDEHLHAHIRAGTTGDWRNHLTRPHLFVLARHRELIEQLGYAVR